VFEFHTGIPAKPCLLMPIHNVLLNKTSYCLLFLSQKLSVKLRANFWLAPIDRNFDRFGFYLAIHGKSLSIKALVTGGPCGAGCIA
jgi:hypothetical protein